MRNAPELPIKKPMMQLNKKQEDLLDNFADAIVDAEEIYEKKKEDFSARFNELLYSPEERDYNFFVLAANHYGDHVLELFNINIEDFLNVAPNQRTLTGWTAPLTQLISILRSQALSESGLILETIEKSATYVDDRVKLGKSLSEKELKEASKAGISKKRVKNRKDKRNGL
jgi:hypothetical protein